MNNNYDMRPVQVNEIDSVSEKEDRILAAKQHVINQYDEQMRLAHQIMQRNASIINNDKIALRREMQEVSDFIYECDDQLFTEIERNDEQEQELVKLQAELGHINKQYEENEQRLAMLPNMEKNHEQDKIPNDPSQAQAGSSNLTQNASERAIFISKLHEEERQLIEELEKYGISPTMSS